jgi:hypothetical protein
VLTLQFLKKGAKVQILEILEVPTNDTVEHTAPLGTPSPQKNVAIWHP